MHPSVRVLEIFGRDAGCCTHPPIHGRMHARLSLNRTYKHVYRENIGRMGGDFASTILLAYTYRVPRTGKLVNVLN